MGDFQLESQDRIYELTVFKLPDEKALLTDAAKWFSIKAFLDSYDIPFTVEERDNVRYMSSAESSPLVLAVTRHQELLLSSLSEVVAFLQGQQVAAVLEREEEGKHIAYLTLAQSTFNTAENYLQWMVRENASGFTAARLAKGLPWPVSHIVPHRTRLAYWWRHRDLARRTVDDVVNQFDETCKALKTFLGEREQFFSSPCMLDALVMGHMKALKCTDLPVNPLHAVVDKHFNPKNAGLGAAF